MTKYYLQVLKEISICLDHDVYYFHHFEVGDVIDIHMYSDKGPKVVFGGWSEHDAEFTIHWDKRTSDRLSIANCITKGYMVDITKNVERDEKLKTLGI